MGRVSRPSVVDALQCQRADLLDVVDTVPGRRGGDGEPVTFAFEEANEIRSHPCRVPGNIDVVNNLSAGDRISSGIGDHMLVKRNTVLVSLGSFVVVGDDNHHHSSFPGIDEIALGSLTHDVGVFSGFRLAPQI